MDLQPLSSAPVVAEAVFPLDRASQVARGYQQADAVDITIVLLNGKRRGQHAMHDSVEHTSVGGSKKPLHSRATPCLIRKPTLHPALVRR